MIKVIHRFAVIEILFSSSDPPQPVIRRTDISIYSCTLKILVHMFMRYYLFYRINTDHFKLKSFAEISLQMQRKVMPFCFLFREKSSRTARIPKYVHCQNYWKSGPANMLTRL